jgi:hypothetical protein
VSVLALMVPGCFAQMNVGEIAGTVTDPGGDVIVAAYRYRVAG